MERASPFAGSSTTWRMKQKNSCDRDCPMLTGCPGFYSPENTVPPISAVPHLSSMKRHQSTALERWMGKISKEKMWQAIACLACTVVLWINLDDFGISEF